MKRAAVFFMVSVLASVVIDQTIFGQTSAPPQGAASGSTPAALAPGAPAGANALSGFEDINVYNGRLNVSLPLLKVGGRGEAGYQMTLQVSQPSWLVETNPIYTCPGGSSDCWQFSSSLISPMAGWWNPYTAGYGPGMVLFKQFGSEAKDCFGATHFVWTNSYLVFIAPDGSEHNLYDTATGGGGVIGHNCADGPFFRGGTRSPAVAKPFVARDGSGMKFLPDAGSPWFVVLQDIIAPDQNHYQNANPLVTGTLLMKDGTKYLVDTGLVRVIEDRNGNKVNFNYATVTVDGKDSITPYVTSIIDPLQRTISIEYDYNDASHGICDRITFSGLGDSPRRIWIQKSLVRDKLRSGYSASTALFPELDATITAASNQFRMPSQVFMPNGQVYDFQYNPYGEIARVGLPTGGAIEYDHGAGISNTASISGAYASGQVLDGMNFTVGVYKESTIPWSPFIYRRLLTRRTYPTGGAGAGNEAGSTVYSLPESATSSTHSTFGNKVDTVSITNALHVDATQFGAAGSSAISQVQHYFHTGTARNSSQTGGASNVHGGPGANLEFRNTGIPDAPDAFEGKEYRTDIPGFLSVQNVWGEMQATLPVPYSSPKICQTNTTTDGNATSARLFRYDRDSGGTPLSNLFENLSDTYEYDFGAAPPISIAIDAASAPFPVCSPTFTGYARRTHADYLADAAYVAPGINILNLPSQQTVYGPSGQAARTTFEYDIYSTDANHAALKTYGSVPGYDTGLTGVATRGNVTAVSGYLDLKNANVTSFNQYDILGNVVATIDAEGHKTTVDYDATYAYALPTTVTSPASARDPVVLSTATVYDVSLGRPTSISSRATQGGSTAVIETTTVAYGNNGQDLLDRPSAIVRAANSPADTTQTVYIYTDTPGGVALNTYSDLNGYPESSGGAGGVRTAVLFDGFGRAKETQAYEGGGSYISTQTEYDGAGRPYRTSNPYRPAGETVAWTTNYFDGAGRVTDLVSADTSRVHTSYGSTTSLLLSEVSSAATLNSGGAVTGYKTKRQLFTDGLGRLAKVVEDPDTLAHATLYGYTPLDQLTQVTQGVQTRNFYYDSLKRLTRAVNPESDAICYGVTLSGNQCLDGYDGNGNLLKKKDLNNITVTMTYDALNRPLTKSYLGGAIPTQDVTWTWDTVRGGSLTSVASVSGPVVTYGSYDALGRVTSSTQAVAGYDCGGACSFAYTWNKAGGLQTYRMPSGRLVTYTPDAAGRTATVASGSTTYASLLTGTDPTNGAAQLAGYAPHGGKQRLALGNGLIERTGYNNRLQPVSIQLGQLGNPQSVSGLGIFYCPNGQTNCADNNGSVQWQTISPLGVTQTYSYDKLDRISGAAEAPTAGGASVWSKTFEEDRYGNMWVSANQGLPVNGLEPSSHSAYDPANNRFTDSLNYDPVGNRTLVSPYQLKYDAENRVVSATSDINGSTSYTYDGEGRRVLSVQSNGTYRLYARDAMGEVGAEYTNEVLTTGTKYFSLDHLGSTRVLTDTSAGFAPERHDYLPYGGDLGQMGLANRTSGLGYGGSGTRVLFTGKERDAESGLDFFGARYMSSAQGRFTSPDEPLIDQHAVDPQSWNLYAYVTNNPLRFIDRNGRAKIEIRYNTIGPGYTHSYVVVTDRNGTQTYFRGGPTAGGSSSPGLSLPSYSGGSSSQYSRSGSSGSSGSSSLNSSNSSSPGSGPGGPGANTGPFGAIVAEHGAYTPDSIDYSTHPAGSITVLSNDQPASGYVNDLGKFESAVNQSGIPYNPLSTNSNAYATGAVRSLGLTPPTNHPLAPGSGTNLAVTPLPPPPPPPPLPSCAIPGTGGACKN